MEKLREHLVKSLKGGQAFVPIEKALRGINPELRNVKQSSNLHTIWEELEHMRIAQEDIFQYMINPAWKSPKWPDGYWPEPIEQLTNEKWKNTYDRFITDFNKVIDLVNNPEIDPLDVIPHTTAHTYLREFCIVIEHNAYHIGKIVDIRKALNDW